MGAPNQQAQQMPLNVIKPVTFFDFTTDLQTETITADERTTRLTAPGNGLTGILKHPPATEVPHVIFRHKVIARHHASTLGIKFVDDNDVDLVGDNATAVDDEVVLYSDGYEYVVLKDVTT